MVTTLSVCLLFFHGLIALADDAILLTRAEVEFLAKHPIIRLGTDDRWEPYTIKKADGSLEGFEIDLMELITGRTGANIQIVTGPWTEMVDRAKNRKIDGLTSSTESKERAQFFAFTNSYLRLFPVFIVSGQNPLKIEGMDDFAGSSIAILKGHQFYLNLLRKYPSVKILEAPSELEAIKWVIEGKAAAAVVATTFYNYFLKIFGKDIKVGYVSTDNPLDIVFSIRKDWPELVSIFNKALASLPEEAKNEIFFRWFGIDYTGLSLTVRDEQIPLTTREQAWIKAHPDIHLGVNPSRQPIEYLDNKKEFQGITSDYVHLLNKRLGLKMRIAPYRTWLQVIEAVPEKGVDVLPGVTETSERKKYLRFTAPYLNIDWVVVTRKEAKSLNNLAELEGKVTAVCKGTSVYEYLQDLHPGIPLLPETETLRALEDVLGGKAAAAVVERNTASLIINGYRMYSLQINQNLIQLDDSIAFAVRKDWPELVDILNKGLDSISQEEREAIEQKWQAVPIQIGFTRADMFRIISLVVAVMGIFVAVSLFWNRRLKREILEKTEAEQKRRQAEENLIESNEKYLKAFQTSPYAITITTPEQGLIIEVNDAFSTISGYSKEETLNRSIHDLDIWETPQDREAIISDLQTGRPILARELQFRTKEGKMITGLLSAQWINLRQGPCILSTINDITEHKKTEHEKNMLQHQLVQSQKMELVGQLAGGVAHDYNNALNVIIGFTELAMGQLTREDSLYTDLEEILSAARRSADITRQLLAFARKQTIAPQVLNVNDSLTGMLKMLRRIIGEDISLAWVPGPEIWQVNIDPTQIDQIMVNLCINGRDAIKGVGRIVIETGNVSLDKDYCDHGPDLVPGDYVMIAVSDNGTGIAPEILDKIFEPFFTTKEIGKGTGLGLATVYGIVKQNNGYIFADSELGRGTTIRIYLPRHHGRPRELPAEKPPDLPRGSGEVILLVEDDRAILKLGERILRDLGYSVLSTTSSVEAVRLAGEHTGEIHLLITDVVMPDMNGSELAEMLKNQYPDMKCLFMSGYTADVIANRGVLDEGIYFMPKPFSIQDMAVRTRAALANS